MRLTRRSLLRYLGIGSAVAVSGVSMASNKPVLRTLVAGKGLTVKTEPDIYVDTHAPLSGALGPEARKAAILDYEKGQIIQGSDGHLYKAIGTS